MLNIMEVHETNQMIEQEKLDVRTITMGISLLDCVAGDVDGTCARIYDKITTCARDLVSTGKAIERDYGIPIVNKRITVTPISLVGGSVCRTSEDFVAIAHALDKAAQEVGVDLIGGYSALVSKSMTKADELLIRSLPQALSQTDIVCSSVNVGSTKTGIDMDAVELLGHIVKDISYRTRDTDSYGCVKFVAFCNAPDDNPFMAGGFHGVTEGDAVINVGVSGPGVVSRALDAATGKDFEFLCETIKRTAFKITRVGQLVAQEASRRLGVPFGIIDLSLAPTPAVGDSVGEVLEKIGLTDKEETMPNALSGGQKQRLLISRALAAHPEILILDDSSSALDYKTDAALRKAIFDHHQNSTTIMVAQRVSSVQAMTNILVMDDGRCIGYGDHAHLLETCPAYREIYETQMGALA